MMEFRKAPPIATLTLLLFTTSVIADNNGLIFPPIGDIPNVNYPPQTTVNPNLRPLYAFGQSQNQMMMPRPEMNRNQYNPYQNSIYRNYPSQMPSLGRFPLQNKSYQNQKRQVTSNNSRFPFGGGNTPFSGNSFGMPSNPVNNMFGGNNSSMPFFGNNNNSMPFFGNNNNRSMPFFGNNNNSSMPFFGNTRKSNRKKAWGTERNIWPDFYTDFTDEAWDTVTSGPRDLGTMPGGWRFPHISTPDPVTVSDAITNQFPPMLEEGGNMMDFSDWGIFD